MEKIRKKKFVETVRGKVVISFAFVLGALVLTLLVNRVAFQRITSIIQDLSRPNDKLIALTSLHRDVVDLMDLQRIEAMEDKSEPSEMFLNETKAIDTGLDELRVLFKEEPAQLERIGSLDSLMHIRNQLFLKYLRVRYNFVKKGVLDKQLKALSEKMDNENLKIDSNVVTTEKTTRTTTVIPGGAQQTQAPKKRRWFGRNRKEEPVITAPPEVIVEERLAVKVDTLAIATRDSIISNIETSLLEIETDRSKGRKFLRGQELALIRTNDLLMDELLEVIREVENQEIGRMKARNNETVALASETIDLTRMITIIFILIALVLGVLIFADVMRSNKYRNELEIAKAEAEYHSMAKQRFLANMSHEIRTPLQSIIGYSEQLSANSKDDNIAAIARSSGHLLQVVNEVLDYSRIISGKFTFENTRFHLREIVDEVFHIIRFQAEKKGLEFRLEFPPAADGLLLEGDPFRLKQILYNLLGNAVKFTNAGEVKLAVIPQELNGRYRVRFVVEDTGVGMRQEELEHIFNQFERAENTNNQTGTGLGLSIVRELVEKQGGRITVTSDPGKGSVFAFELTFAAVAFLEEGPASEEAAPALQFEGKVWIVDDDELILRLCSIILTKYNIAHTCFGSAEKLLEAWPDKNVKVIFADVRLPKMSGIELCAELRKRDIGEVKIIALTAQILPEEKAMMLSNGYDDLLLKPFTERDLVGILKPFAIQEKIPLQTGTSVLRQMVSDPADLEAIVAQFRSDTASDLYKLEEMLVEDNTRETIMLVHRIAGRTAQMGADAISSAWKEMEKTLRKAERIQAHKEEIRSMSRALETFLESYEP